MSVSAIFGTRLAAVSIPPSITGGTTGNRAVPRIGYGGTRLVTECSSRPQKKATAHHKKSRPRKTQPWDIRRGPTVYPPLPPLPPEWTLVTEADATDDSFSQSAESSSQSPES